MEATHAPFWATASTDKKEANTRIIDSGASQHMSLCKERMVNFREFAVPEKVRLGDNRVVYKERGQFGLRSKLKGNGRLLNWPKCCLFQIWQRIGSQSVQLSKGIYQWFQGGQMSNPK